MGWKMERKKEDEDRQVSKEMKMEMVKETEHKDGMCKRRK